MVDTADVVVIGGGVIGTSIACALASSGVRRVILLEKGALASGASGRSSALVRMHYTNDCYSADRHAILGPVRGIDGLYLATAFSGSGFKIAPAVGTCLAELTTEGRARTVDITAFRPERFAEGRRIEGRHPYAPRRDHVEPTR